MNSTYLLENGTTTGPALLLVSQGKLRLVMLKCVTCSCKADKVLLKPALSKVPLYVRGGAILPLQKSCARY